MHIDNNAILVLNAEGKRHSVVINPDYGFNYVPRYIYDQPGVSSRRLARSNTRQRKKHKIGQFQPLYLHFRFKFTNAPEKDVLDKFVERLSDVCSKQNMTHALVLDKSIGYGCISNFDNKHKVNPKSKNAVEKITESLIERYINEQAIQKAVYQKAVYMSPDNAEYLFLEFRTTNRLSMTPLSRKKGIFNLNDYLVENKNKEEAFVPRIECADGFSLSVQCDKHKYCYPKEDYSDVYTSVEVGFPSSSPEFILGYAEWAEYPTETIYTYVPIELVERLILLHGGVKK